MSRRANPKLIGGFVIGAVALMVVAALVFGTFTFFQNTRRFVVFFEGSVEGLTVGSPVLFRGVPIGTVTQVTIRYNREKNDLSIPVIVEINSGVIEGWDPDESGPFNTTRYRKLLDKGLRARLESTSLVTGQKAVQLEFFPGTPIVLQIRYQAAANSDGAVGGQRADVVGRSRRQGPAQPREGGLGDARPGAGTAFRRQPEGNRPDPRQYELADDEFAPGRGETVDHHR